MLLTAVPRPGSSMAGRFAHVLRPEEQAALAATYHGVPGALPTQLVFTPRRRRNENVTRTPRLLPNVLELSGHRGRDERAMQLADIAVTADSRTFSLVELSTGRCIDMRVLHALEGGTQTPPLARFLAEVAGARCAAYKPFDFGAGSRLPFLPRVRYRRTLLAQARWLLMADDLPGRKAPTPEWEHAFDAWRGRLRVPVAVACPAGGCATTPPAANLLTSPAATATSVPRTASPARSSSWPKHCDEVSPSAATKMPCGPSVNTLTPGASKGRPARGGPNTFRGATSTGGALTTTLPPGPAGATERRASHGPGNLPGSPCGPPCSRRSTRTPCTGP